MMTYTNLGAVMEANDQAGGHWFDDDTIQFFKTKFESDLIGGRYFITSERGPHFPRAYSIRMADEDAVIQTIGDFMEHKTLKDAMTALEARRT